jgi:hypothetical protein
MSEDGFTSDHHRYYPQWRKSSQDLLRLAEGAERASEERRKAGRRTCRQPSGAEEGEAASKATVPKILGLSVKLPIERNICLFSTVSSRACNSRLRRQLFLPSGPSFSISDHVAKFEIGGVRVFYNVVGLAHQIVAETRPQEAGSYVPKIRGRASTKAI